MGEIKAGQLEHKVKRFICYHFHKFCWDTTGANLQLYIHSVMFVVPFSPSKDCKNGRQAKLLSADYLSLVHILSHETESLGLNNKHIIMKTLV